MEKARGIASGRLGGRKKKASVATVEVATEADQPGMGMTNRVIPAQGEERGASFTLIRLDGDAYRKFQPSCGNFRPWSRNGS
jgi:hypothetical protein